MKLNLSTKLILHYLLVVIFVFTLSAFFLLQRLKTQSKENLKNNLITQARLISEIVSAESIEHRQSTIVQRQIQKAQQKTEARLTIIAPDGTVLGDSQTDPATMENHKTRPEILDALNGKIGYSSRFSYTISKMMLYTAVPVYNSGNQVIGVIRVALPLLTVTELTVDIVKNLLLGLALALIFTLIFGWLSTYVVTKPIFSISNAVARAAEGDLSQKISLTSKDEIGALAQALNSLFSQLQDKIEEIRKEKDKVTALVSSMAEGVIACDAESRIFMVNEATEKIFSVRAQECRGKLLLEAIRTIELDAVLTEILKTGKPTQKELTLLLPVQKTFSITASPLLNAGHVSGAVILLHDISEIKRLENVRKDFISNVSHELRTPLTSIKGFIETLLNGALDDQANNRRFLNIINNHAQRLGKLIDDILDLSALESQQLSLNMDTIDLKELIEETVEDFNPQLAKAKTKCTIAITEKKLSVHADRDRIKQVLVNLIDNAIKFNKERGNITITALPAVKDMIKITIIDTGQGIPQKDLPRIFERFYRVDKARSRELGGTGLGLSIVKHIIEGHHGQVGVESAEEIGSTFWFTLPFS